ncbi:MAG: hypothetical protein Q4C91_20955 [Eubacteriales bacterium]|nr:hypothetical protein [Eubacteriales bacterium]
MKKNFSKKSLIMGTALLFCSLQISLTVFGADETEKDLQEIYNTIQQDYYALKKDEDGNYFLSDFYYNNYTVKIEPRKRISIQEDGAGSGWLYFSYENGESEYFGTYYLMPLNEEYGLDELAGELEYDYENLCENSEWDVERSNALQKYKVDNHNVIADKITYTDKKENISGSIRNFFMIIDDKDTLAVQCIVTEVIEEQGKCVFSEDELAKELMENIELEEIQCEK